MVRYKNQVNTLHQVLNLINKMSTSAIPTDLTNFCHAIVLGIYSLMSGLAAFNWDEFQMESEDENLYTTIRNVVV